MSEQTEQDGVTRAPERPPRRPHGPMGMSLGGEKATDFRGTMKKLLHFMGKIQNCFGYSGGFCSWINSI